MNRLAFVLVFVGFTGTVWAEGDDEDAPPPVETLITEPATADLTVKQLPPKLQMRSKLPTAASVKAAKKKKTVAAAAGASADADVSASSGDVGYQKFPNNFRDLQERVKFRFSTGIDFEQAPASGDVQRGGAPLPPGFADNRPWVVGDVVVGARGIYMPSLGGYFLSSYAFDTSDSLATRSGQIYPADSTGQHIAIKAGYAEWGHDDRKPDDDQPSKLWLRGGRQFRLDGGNLFAYFDGATVGYKEKSWNVSAFAGQRVVLYVDSPAGILYGATAAFSANPSYGASDAKKEIPIKVALDFMGLAVDSLDATNAVVTDNRQMLALTASAKFSQAAKLDVRARMTVLPDETDPDRAPKIALGRAGARFRYEAGNLTFIGDVEERLGGDLAYDLATPSAVDIVDIAQRLGVGLNQPVDATDIGLRVDYWNKEKDVEVLVFGKTEQPAGQPLNVDQKAYIEAGIGLAGSPIGSRGAGVWTTAQYKFRQYTDGTDDQMAGSNFADSSVSGVDTMHEIAVEGTLATKAKEGKHWRFAAGGFFRVYDYSTPYRQVTNDARGGGRADLQWWFKREVHLDLAGEVAQPSPTLSRDLTVMSSLRAALEVQW